MATSIATARLGRALLFFLLGLVLNAGCSDDDYAPIVGVDPGTDAPPVGWEEYLAHLDQPAGLYGDYIVDGDTRLHGDDEVEAFYLRYLESAGGAELTVKNVLGADVIWSRDDAFDLSYCVSDDFGTRKAEVVHEIDEAARSWSARIGVRYRYVPGEDDDCDNRNERVLFNVRPISARFNAAAFFPDDRRSKREVVIDSDAFTTTLGGRDFQGILRHELGHTLGFRHEHIEISCTTETTASSRQVTSYDVDSVMHYPQCRPDGDGGYRQTTLDFAGATILYGMAPSLLAAAT